MKEKPEDVIRRRIEKKFKARQDFLSHIGIYLAVNGMLWVIWLLTSGVGSHPWPIWSTVFWGIGVVGNGLDYYFKYGGGRDRFEHSVEAEVEREMQRYYGQRKNDGVSEEPFYEDEQDYQRR